MYNYSRMYCTAIQCDTVGCIAQKYFCAIHPTVFHKCCECKHRNLFCSQSKFLFTSVRFGSRDRDRNRSRDRDRDCKSINIRSISVLFKSSAKQDFTFRDALSSRNHAHTPRYLPHTQPHYQLRCIASQPSPPSMGWL